MKLWTSIVCLTLLAVASHATVPDSGILANFLLNNKSNSTGIPLSFHVPASYWTDIHSNPYDVTETAERILATYGLNLYDGSVWAIAVALNGHFDASTRLTNMLLSNQCGQLSEIRGCKNFQYGDNNWNCTSITSSGYFFRMVTDIYANKDPMTGQAVAWMDWKPVTGENAWASLIGPIQTGYLRLQAQTLAHWASQVQQATSTPSSSPSSSSSVHLMSAVESESADVEDVHLLNKARFLQSLTEAHSPFDLHDEDISMVAHAKQKTLMAMSSSSASPSSSSYSSLFQADQLHAEVMQKWTLDTPELKLALSTLETFEAMQSPMGAIYYAPQGTYNATRGSISTENCASSYAGLRMFRQVLQSITNDTRAAQYATRVGYLMERLENYMQNYTYNATLIGPSQPGFTQGGIFNVATSTFEPELIFAVDVQTWGGTVFAEFIEKWFGVGATWKIWETAKKVGGYWENGRLLGVGFSSQPQGNTSTSVLSGEWTFGAMTLVRKLVDLYASSAPELSIAAAQDFDSMRDGMARLRHSNGDGTAAYLYTDKRYNIPFGWYGNPVPSTASTSWAVFVENAFDPFELGGGGIAVRNWNLDALVQEFAAVQSSQ